MKEKHKVKLENRMSFSYSSYLWNLCSNRQLDGPPHRLQNGNLGPPHQQKDNLFYDNDLFRLTNSRFSGHPYS